MKRLHVEYILLAIFVLTFPVVAFISTLPSSSFRNDITEWGDHTSEAYQQFSDYRKEFGVNEFVVISWPGCDLDDPRVEEVTTKIETEFAGLVQQVSNGQRAYWELRDQGGLSETAALNRLGNVFISRDSGSTAVAFNLRQSASTDRGQVMTRLPEILRSSGVDPATANFAGLAHNLYMLDKEGLESPFRMVPLIMLVAFVLTFVFVRNIWLAFFINALGTYTGALAFNFVWLADVDMNAIIWPLPTLTMLLTVSAALHFLSYFEKAVELVLAGDRVAADVDLLDNQIDSRFSLQARRRISNNALRMAIKPMLCCVLTTAIGLSSLLLSSSSPVRQFGGFGTISILCAVGLLLLWFPKFLTLIRHADRIAARANNHLIEVLPQERPTDKNDGWVALAAITRQFRWSIIACSVLAIIWCSFGIPKIKTGSGLDNFFPPTHKELKDAIAVETSIGPLNSIELLLRFNDHDKNNDRSRIKGLKALSSRIVKETPFASCVSAATFSPVWEKRPSPLQKVVELKRLDLLRKRLVEAGFLSTNPQTQEEVWRISCRYSIEQHLHLPQLEKQLTEMVQKLFYRDDQLVFKGEELQIITTGEFVLFDSIDREFFRDLMLTYLTAWCAITVVVFLALQSTSSMLIAILPNLFPVVIVLGLTGHVGFSLDVASLMTASVALGIAVDDTLHFLLWHRDASCSDASACNPTEVTLRYCGKAMLQTSMILGSSIALYGLCGFLPTVRFGILLSAMLFAALIGDLILLPALVAKRKEG